MDTSTIARPALPAMTSTRPPGPLHIVPLDAEPVRSHFASSICWCGPTQSHRDLATGAPVFVHADLRRHVRLVSPRPVVRAGGAPR